MTKEKLLTYHMSLAESLAEALQKPMYFRNPKKVGRVLKEIKRSGGVLQKFPEKGDYP